VTAEQQDTAASKLSDLWLGRLKIGLIAAAIGGTFSFGSSVFNRFDVFNTALAQTQAQTAANTVQIAHQGQRIEGMDAGARVAVENLRREIADERTSTDKKLTSMQLTLETLVREVRKK
jgi:hypothetical protein